MRTGVIIRSYKLTDYLERVIRNYAWVNRIVVSNCIFKNYNDCFKDDKTLDIAMKLQKEGLPVTTVSKPTPVSQVEAFELAQNFLDGIDICFISDADEFILQSDQRNIAQILYSSDRSKIRCKVIDYKDPEPVDGKLRAYQERTHLPVVAFKVPGRFTGTRYVEGDGIDMIDVSMHHFGYAVKDLQWKMENLWYPPHSVDQITGTLLRNLEAPKELIKAMEIKN